jgi:hypothetical protein
LSVPDEGYSRNALCALNLMSTFLFLLFIYISSQKYKWKIGRDENMHVFYSEYNTHALRHLQKEVFIVQGTWTRNNIIVVDKNIVIYLCAASFIMEFCVLVSVN